MTQEQASGRPIAEYGQVTRAQFDAIVDNGEPAVLRGVVAHWPVVAAGKASPEALAAYLRRFDRGRQVGAMLGPPRIKGRFGYNDDLSSLNFKRQHVKIAGALDYLLSVMDEADPPAFALQSVRVWNNLAGFEQENALPLLDPAVEPRVWIGNRVTVAAHHDPSDNIAAVVAGRRRFTLFPPGQIANLYMGPFEKTPAGTTISLVDFDAPDAARFPGFSEAMGEAHVADLAPGDALYIPYMWWHHVRSLERLNMLVNYWWKAESADPSHPMDAMLLAMLTIRGLPERYRDAWRAHFDHYVFGDVASQSGHIPEAQHGVLGPLTPERIKGLREAVVGGLERKGPRGES